MINAVLRTCVWALAMLLSAAASAEPVVRYVPEDALGFALIRNLAGVNAKLENVAKIFQEVSPMPIPAPLAVVKAATGLGAGINEQGDALLAVLPGDSESPNHRPLLLAPVSDYTAFANSIGGDVSGEICRVTIAGEEVLAAKLDEYAALMNVEHRDALEAVLAAKPHVSPAAQPLVEWTSNLDVAVVLTPAGVERLTAMGQSELATQRAAVEEQFGEPHFADHLRQFRATLAMYEQLLGFMGGELKAVAIGLAIDDGTNLEISTQAVLVEAGGINKLAPAKSSPPSALAGYRDEPYVFAGGGPVPPVAATFAFNSLRQHPGLYGFEKLSEDQWKQVEQVVKDTLEGIRSTSIAMLLGAEDDPLFSNVYLILKVDDSAAYLKSYAHATEQSNELLAENTTGIHFRYEVSETQVADKPALLTTVDLGEVANDPNVPMMKPLMEGLLGRDGKMRTYLVAADENTVYVGIAEKDAVASRIDAVLKQESSFAESPGVETTVALLDPDAAWVALVSPKGAVAWFTRYISLLVAPFGQGAPAVPEFPDSPPVGVSLKIADGRIATELVCPADLLKAMAAYLKKTRDAS